jgi:hypothetical protein
MVRDAPDNRPDGLQLHDLLQLSFDLFLARDGLQPFITETDL